MSSRAVLEGLLDRGEIEMNHADLLDQAPSAVDVAAARGRLRGMMLGLAIGDSLGNTSESMNPGARAAKYGAVRDYLPNRYADGEPRGVPSDDTQLAFWTLEQMLEDGHLDPERLMAKFGRQQIYGIGSTVRRSLEALRSGQPWQRCGQRSAGNGAVMRIAPLVYPHVARPSIDLWADVALATVVTHNDTAALASSLAFVCQLWSLLDLDRPPPSHWWAETFVAAAAPFERDTVYLLRGGEFEGFEGSLTQFVELTVGHALRRDWTTRRACDSWYSGAYLLETVPSVLYILARYADDPQEAIVRAVNDTRDNDTIAAIVGAAVGALHGEDALPLRWRRGLLGRTVAGDDGRVQHLLALADARFLGDAVPEVG